MLRKTDFSKLAQNKNKSLEKKFSLFTPDDKGIRYAGRNSLGPFLKKGKLKGSQKRYYIAPHRRIAYFALEILQYLGVNTPKARMAAIPDKNTQEPNNYIATKEIPHYIPIAGVTTNDAPNQFSDDSSEENNEVPEEVNPAQNQSPLAVMRKKYELDVYRQLFSDVEEKKQYRISGNFFALDLLFTLVADDDAMADTNFGFVIHGNRAFAVAIDKDQVSFDKYSYNTLCQEVDSRIYEGCNLKEHVVIDLFRSREREQLLSVLYKLKKGLVPNKKTKQCIFDKIFSNTRIKNTECFKNFSFKEKCENFKKAAQSTLDFYEKFLGKKYLKAFAYRENLRYQIADKILDKFDFKKILVDPCFIRDIIVEDLRGPYYKAHFHRKYPLPNNFISGAHWEFSQTRECIGTVDLTNQRLIFDIADAVKKEFHLPYKSPYRFFRWASEQIFEEKLCAKNLL